MEKFLCSIISKPRLQEFSIHELISLSSLFNISPDQLFSSYNLNLSTGEKYSQHFTPLISQNPFLELNLSEPLCKKIASRSVSIERFSFLISSGSSLSTLIHNTISRHNSDLKVKQLISENSSFAFRFDTYHGKISQSQKQEIIDAFASVGFNGAVELNTPQRTFIVSVCKENFYFSLEVAKSKVKRAHFYSKYNLPDREYLGPTTTDLDLAMLMVNQAQVVQDSFVLDPFVGTGGILLAASIFKPFCFGGDIDMRVLKGLSVGRSTKGTQADIFTNFRNYGFQVPEIFRCDNSNPCFKKEGFFDAIICDPPYGVRAGSRKAKKGTTEIYEGKKVFWDLMELASRVLRVGGRLVFLLPTERELYDPESLPSHPRLELVANSENILSRKISRRLITMVKLENTQVFENSGEKSFYNDIRTTWYRKEMR
jgi:tRNA (guanine10-N2)-methyltransferase